jgi:hypothetical protein
MQEYERAFKGESIAFIHKWLLHLIVIYEDSSFTRSHRLLVITAMTHIINSEWSDLVDISERC